MDSVSLGNEWSILGDIYFRKIQLFSSAWEEEVDFNRVKIAVAPFGGHIAVLSPGTHTEPASLTISNASGKILTKNSYHDSAVLDMIWTQEEELLVIQEIGRVNIYNLYGQYIKHFGLTSLAETNGLLDCKFYYLPNGGTGLAFLTDKRYQIIHVNNVRSTHDHRPFQLPDLPSSGSGLNTRPPSAWTTFVDVSSDLICALVARDKILYRLEQGGNCKEVFVGIGGDYTAIVSMCVSLNQKLIALYTDTGILWVGDVGNLSHCHCEYSVEDSDRRGGIRPRQMMWCSTTAVLLSWPNNLQVVGSKMDTMDFFYAEPIHLVPEIDGCRIITVKSHELFQRVPIPLENLGKIGANCGAYFLYEAEQKLSERSGRAHECFQAIMGPPSNRNMENNDRIDEQRQSAMLDAVKQCLDAASHAWSIQEQKTLLRAARLGRGFLIVDRIADKFTEVCRDLRLLNVLRASSPIAMPLTYKQLDSLGKSKLINRLLARNHYPLALKIAEEMQLSPEEGVGHILSHWAFQKVMIPRTMKYGEDKVLIDPDSEENAEKLSKKIFTQLTLYDRRHVCYADVAKHALECGRRRLAEKLLEYEPKSSEQVKLLLQLESYSKALSRSVDSGDPELILSTMNELRQNMKSKIDLFNIVRRHPTAMVILQRQLNPNSSLFVNNGKTKSSNNTTADDLLTYEYEWKDLLNNWKSPEDEQPSEQARLTLKKAFACSDLKQRRSLVTLARDDFKRSMNDFMMQECDQYLRLLENCELLECQKKRPIYSSKLSVQTILRELIVLGDVKLIDQAKRDFRVPDKRFWTLRLEIMAQQDQWLEIEKLSRHRKKPPVGFEVFVEVCLKQKNLIEGEKYVNKIDAEKRVRYLYKLGRVNDAINLAAEQKNDADLAYLQWNLSKTDRTACDRVLAIRKQLMN